MDNGEKILSLLEKMYIDLNKRLLNLETGFTEFKADLGNVKDNLGNVKDNLGNVKTEMDSIKAIVIKIEHDHGQKLGALFDGQKLIFDKLDRVEAQVSKHEEIIFRRVK